jgi:hypothetical protein
VCQPRRPLSPADRQAQANEDVERIAEAAYDLVRAPWRWDDSTTPLSEHAREQWRGYVRSLLLRGIIRPGLRPPLAPPLEGQTTIDEVIDDDPPG